jgi:propanol-preferring alcohol dehydrogenase
MCRTDVQLLDGYFRKYAESSFPLTPGHEIAGEVHKIGGLASKSGGFERQTKWSWSAVVIARKAIRR